MIDKEKKGLEENINFEKNNFENMFRCKFRKRFENRVREFYKFES